MSEVSSFFNAGSSTRDYETRFQSFVLSLFNLIVFILLLLHFHEFSKWKLKLQSWIQVWQVSCSFQICIMLCADHGPCVSGAHNTIVTARAGKDLVSSLVSGCNSTYLDKDVISSMFDVPIQWQWHSEIGLLTIGPRFGGAIDDAARYFKDAYDRVRFVLCWNIN